MQCFRGAMFSIWVLLLILLFNDSIVRARDDWNEARGTPQPQRGGGMAQTCLAIVASAVGGMGFRRFVYAPLKNSRRKRLLNKYLKKGIRGIEKDPNILNIQLNIAENQRLLDSTLEVAREWEKRLYALPDRNGDGRISHMEFDDYMAKYRRMHPQLRDSDLPRWTDMDTDKTGYITFQEWLDYMDRIRMQRATMELYGY